MKKNSLTYPAAGPSHWRSLEELHALAIPETGVPGPEFPPGADLPPDGVSRRRMFGILGATMALGGLSACRRPIEEIVPFVLSPEDRVPGVSKHFASTFSFGLDAYGVLVESFEGRPIKVEGNELHPASRGRANAWMQAMLLDLYDPDRSTQPTQGSAENHRPSTWEDFAAFWKTLAAEHQSSGGSRLGIVVPFDSSPTRARLVRKLRERFPQLAWVAYEPLSDHNVFSGIEQWVGAPRQPLYRLDQVDVLLTLDADLLAGESRALTHSCDLGERRAASLSETATSSRPLRHYAIESSLTLTGSAADHRLAMPRHRAPQALAQLALEISKRLGPPATSQPEQVAAPNNSDRRLERRLRLIADDLVAAAGRALIVVGRHQPPPVHALACALNEQLKAGGRTVDLMPLEPSSHGSPRDLAQLAAELRSGRRDTVVVIDSNPAFSAAADLGMKEALAAARHSVALSAHRDETAALCDWHLPLSHVLESWGDARSQEGSPSVVQPLIRPLFDSKNAIEMLALLADDEISTAFEAVRDTWQTELLRSSNFESHWNQVLHNGLASAESLKETADPGVDAAGVDAADLEAIDSPEIGISGEGPSDEGREIEQQARGHRYDRALEACARAVPDESPLELTFGPSLSVYDGRFANNAWLQELPDPITKLTWGQALCLSPDTAAERGVVNEDIVTLTIGERSLEVPVLVLPGQADGSLHLTLGHGRRAAGRVGSGVGVDAYRLRTSDGSDHLLGVEMRPTGERTALASTQGHWWMEGRDLVRESSFEDHRTAEQASHPEGHAVELWRSSVATDGRQWGMSIDLTSCIGCNACVVACQAENNIPVVGPEQVRKGREMHWLRIDRYFSGAEQDPAVAFQPVPCMHCENAPCEEVCPVGATVHDSEGLNAMVYNRCIGTRYCSNNCPYKVRRFNYLDYTGELPELVQMAMNPDVTVRSRGVMEKCTYCVQRLNEAKGQSRRERKPLSDGDVQTACQQTCPTRAIRFGDLNDAESSVVEAKKSSRSYTLLDEVNARPRTSYLSKLRHPHPDWSKP